MGSSPPLATIHLDFKEAVRSHVGHVLPTAVDQITLPMQQHLLCGAPLTPFSGSGLHVGHPEGYTATDILARYKRMRGYNVLHPMGWDAFGLPAEQYAIQTGTHPAVTTDKNIDRFR